GVFAAGEFDLVHRRAVLDIRLAEFPPSFLPYVTEQAVVPGYDKTLPLYNVAMPDGSTRVLAEVRRIGIIGQMVDPKQPGEIVK
ncbi:hypothetical protein ACC734_38940, partial [Rhizobium ruizarguesonis]